MHKIVLFGGTTEGRILTEFLSENKIPSIVCVATEYGEKVLEYDKPVIVRSGKLKPGPMQKLFQDEEVEIVFDATHPYAMNISKNIKKVCKEENIEYVRVLREAIEIEDAVKCFSMDELISYLNETEGIIFSSMGAKEAQSLTGVDNFQERVYLRMLPSPEGMRSCLDLGYPMKNLCGMQGPFSKEFNIAQFKETGADILITKESGNAGGFLEKTDAARECGTRYFKEQMLMKQINIIGMGMSAKTVTGEALELIQDADILIGAKRLINEFSYLNKPSHNAFLSDEIADLISKSDAEKIAILVSGDVGFYSGAEKLVCALSEYDPILVPGISSVSYFFAKCRIPWKEANLISCHGIESNIVSSVRRNRYTFALTGRNIPDLQNQLVEYGFGDLKVWAGENLGLEDEFVTSCRVSDLNKREYGSLTVLIIENPDFDSRVKTGIPDDEFIRAKVPMTKSEVRAVCMSKLDLSPYDIVYDIGCGTGSVSIEMAFAAYEGRVYAFDKNEEAVALVLENARKFHLDNIEAVCGLAPECLNDLPIPDDLLKKQHHCKNPGNNKRSHTASVTGCHQTNDRHDD